LPINLVHQLGVTYACIIGFPVVITSGPLLAIVYMK
jgi:hypothetical protein